MLVPVRERPERTGEGKARLCITSLEMNPLRDSPAVNGGDDFADRWRVI
jgi:hypothetical protein